MTPSPLPTRVLETTFIHLYYDHLAELTEKQTHYCSLLHPCCLAKRIFQPLLSFRLISLAWNSAFLNISERFPVFQRVEDVWYPHKWHINTRVRRSVVLGRYRVVGTLLSENGDRGVYVAYDFHVPNGCAEPTSVVLKTWVSDSDRECETESAMYRSLKGPEPIHGIPEVFGSDWDPKCEVYVIAMRRLGPSLEDLLGLMGKQARFDEKMVLAVAIQMLDRYKDVHARGVIHNGMKPANICLPPREAETKSMLHVIDFGLSHELNLPSKDPLPYRVDVVGNRVFLSILSHHGISQSQRDDLESLAYLLSYLYHRSLPWDQPYYSPQFELQPQLWLRKMATPSSVLFADMDSVFIWFFKEVKGLSYLEVPDYIAMKGRFEECWRRKGYGGAEGELDWWAIYDGL